MYSRPDALNDYVVVNVARLEHSRCRADVKNFGTDTKVVHSLHEPVGVQDDRDFEIEESHPLKQKNSLGGEANVEDDKFKAWRLLHKQSDLLKPCLLEVPAPSHAQTDASPRVSTPKQPCSSRRTAVRPRSRSPDAPFIGNKPQELRRNKKNYEEAGRVNWNLRS